MHIVKLTWWLLKGRRYGFTCGRRLLRIVGLALRWRWLVLRVVRLARRWRLWCTSFGSRRRLLDILVVLLWVVIFVIITLIAGHLFALLRWGIFSLV